MQNVTIQLARVIGLILCASLFHFPVLGADKRPNILFIIADDQSPFDLKVYNPDSPLDTPNIDRIARNGVVLDGAYQMGSWSGAVCLPSRHMVMSGRSVWHIPDRRKVSTANPNVSNPKLVPPDLADFTMPAVFNSAGYETMRTCKRGNSYEAANAKFTIRKDATKRGGTHESGSAWHADQVLEYLENRETQTNAKPFLIYYGFSHPHDERNGSEALLAKYHATNHRDRDKAPEEKEGQPELPINYLPAHPFHHGHPGLRDEVHVPGVWERRDSATIRNEIGRQFACSENIDIQIGKVLEKLDAMGELDNTYVIYTADHGMAIGRHGLQGKQNLYEHTWRVPYIVMGPGLEKGKRAQGNVYLMDTLATLCDFAGIEPPATNEGTSFLNVLNGQKKKVRNVLFGTYSGGTKPGMRAIRKGNWKLIKYDVLDGKVRETQLFNLKSNPHEFIAQHHDPKVQAMTGASPKKIQTNLADNPRFAQKLKEMESLLLAEMQRLDDPHRLWDQK